MKDLDKEFDDLVETMFSIHPPDEEPYTAGFEIAKRAYRMGVMSMMKSSTPKEIDYHISPRQTKFDFNGMG